MPQLTCVNHHSFTLPPGVGVLPWCPICEKVHADKAILKALTVMGHSPSKRYAIHTLKYLCYLWYNNQKVVIEYDGRDLLEYTAWCTSNVEVWNDRRLVERVKTYVAIDSNHKVIRVSYQARDHNLMDYLQKSLDSVHIYVVMTPDLYVWNTRPNNLEINRYTQPNSRAPPKRQRDTNAPASRSFKRTRQRSVTASTNATSSVAVSRPIPRLVVHDYAQAIRSARPIRF